jgi:hypothetical protein
MRSRLAPVPDDRWSVDESRSVKTVWVWRAFFLMSLVAVGIAIILATNGKTTYAALWGVIAAGWFGISMFLWKKHTDMDR